MPPDSVVLFPAWETLPFERISPSVETMGRRMDVLWRLRTAQTSVSDHPGSASNTPIKIIVAGVRALLQRLSPEAINVEPIRVRPNDVIDPDELLDTLIGFGYRREDLVEHRGEVARRGAIIDVFPSTADAPIRIDLWGDEVDRLTEFTVNDQRSTDDLAEVRIFPARELLPSDAVRTRAAELIAEEPWGREQWERLAEGTVFDGMESWLPWLVDGDTLITDLLPASGKVALLEPRRMRDRANDLLAEEDDLARTLASTWARDADRKFPRLHADTDRLLGTDQPMWTLSSTPEHPDAPMVQATGWGPVVGDGEGLAKRLADADRRQVPRRRRRRRHRQCNAAGRVAARPWARLHHRHTRPLISPSRVATWSPLRCTAAARCPRPSWPSSPRATSPAGGARIASLGRASDRAPASSRT